MSNRPLSLDDFTESLASLSNYQKSSFGGDGERQKLLRTLVRAIDGELTDRQRECVFCYYGQKMKISEIARKLGVYPSTVSRHLTKARGRLENVISYCFERLS